MHKYNTIKISLSEETFAKTNAMYNKKGDRKRMLHDAIEHLKVAINKNGLETYIQEIAISSLYYVSKVKRERTYNICREDREYTDSIAKRLGIKSNTIYRFAFEKYLDELDNLDVVNL